MGEAGKADDRAAGRPGRSDAGFAVFDGKARFWPDRGPPRSLEIDIGCGLGARDILEGNDAVAEKDVSPAMRKAASTRWRGLLEATLIGSLMPASVA